MGLLYRASELVDEYEIIQNVKPCPFCGANKRLLQLWSYFVKCTRCKTEGPNAKSGQEAIDLWNNRV